MTEKNDGKTEKREYKNFDRNISSKKEKLSVNVLLTAYFFKNVINRLGERND